MASKDQDLVDANRITEDLLKDEPNRYPTDEEVEKGKNENERLELQQDAKPWEILEALGVTRSEVGFALVSVVMAIENLREEVARLKAHRHDTSKAYSGRPEM